MIKGLDFNQNMGSFQEEDTLLDDARRLVGLTETILTSQIHLNRQLYDLKLRAGV